MLGIAGKHVYSRNDVQDAVLTAEHAERAFCCCNRHETCYNAVDGQEGTTDTVILRTMKSEFDIKQTTLSIISNMEKRLGELDDPTKSGMSKCNVPEGGGYFRVRIEKNDDVYLRVYKKKRWLRDPHHNCFRIGTQKGDWVYFDSQKQRVNTNAFRTRFDYAALDTEPFKKEKILSELGKIASPFDLSKKGSEYLGLFFDGTGNFRGQSETNVYKIYKIYGGNKFYYGGVGNSIEHNFSSVKSAVAHGFSHNINRAIADLEKFRRKSKDNRSVQIQLFGFSRGAAQANMLATRLKKRGIEVDLLLMMDPVYSISIAGQGSKEVRTSKDGEAHNFVETDISDNVCKAVVLYAAHETRVWFPATKFTTEGKHTKLIAGLTPGNHCDAGGYWSQKGDFQYVSLYWMLEKIASEAPGDPFAGNLKRSQWQHVIDIRLKEITDNHKSRWHWSNVDWFYTLSKNPLYLLKKGIEVIAKELSPILGEQLGPIVARYLLGNQQKKMNIERKFDTFGYPLETLHDWLAGKNALPIANYDYVSKPPPV